MAIGVVVDPVGTRAEAVSAEWDVVRVFAGGRGGRVARGISRGPACIDVDATIEGMWGRYRDHAL